MSNARRTTQLRNIMRDNNLTDADVARLLGRSENTIKMWRCGLHRPIPEHSLQLLIERLK